MDWTLNPFKRDILKISAEPFKSLWSRAFVDGFGSERGQNRKSQMKDFPFNRITHNKTQWACRDPSVTNYTANWCPHGQRWAWYNEHANLYKGNDDLFPPAQLKKKKKRVENKQTTGKRDHLATQKGWDWICPLETADFLLWNVHCYTMVGFFLLSNCCESWERVQWQWRRGFPSLALKQQGPPPSPFRVCLSSGEWDRHKTVMTQMPLTTWEYRSPKARHNQHMQT